jgi:hypothetical protein
MIIKNRRLPATRTVGTMLADTRNIINILPRRRSKPLKAQPRPPLGQSGALARRELSLPGDLVKVIAVILATLVLIESPFPAWASASCPAIERLNEISSRQARVDRETEFGRWYDSSERTTYNQDRLALRWILNGSKYQRLFRLRQTGLKTA